LRAKVLAAVRVIFGEKTCPKSAAATTLVACGYISAIGTAEGAGIEKSAKMICWRSRGSGVAFDPAPTAYPYRSPPI
jgi:hypothetical protein